MNTTNTSLKTLTDAAKKTAKALGLKYTPDVFRSEDLARQAANRRKAGTVMLGEGAFWVVCLADAARLEAAGFEWAPVWFRG